MFRRCKRRISFQKIDDFVHLIDDFNQPSKLTFRTKLLDERDDRQNSCPEFSTEKDHRADDAHSAIIILCDVLKHLLDCSSATWREQYPATRDRNKPVFAHTIGKILGDVCGECVGRLVTIEPGRD